MANHVTTDSIESKTKVTGKLEVRDLFFIIGYSLFAYMIKGVVHAKLQLPFMIFSVAVAVFLSLKSSFNRKRRNYESLYFLLTKDVAVYHPWIKQERTDVIEEEE